MLDDPFAIDQVGNPTRENAQRPGHAIEISHLALPVGKQNERQFPELGEESVRRFGIATDSDHRGTRLLEVFEAVPEGTGLRRTGRRAVLGIEEQDDRGLAAKIRQPDCLAGWASPEPSVIYGL
jgi:hypothetical protein